MKKKILVAFRMEKDLVDRVKKFAGANTVFGYTPSFSVSCRSLIEYALYHLSKKDNRDLVVPKSASNRDAVEELASTLEATLDFLEDSPMHGQVRKVLRKYGR